MRLSEAVLAVAIGVLVTACDLNKSIQAELQTFQQFKQIIIRATHRVLHNIELNFEALDRATRAPAPVAAKLSAAFNQSIGVNVHIAYTWTTYADVTLVQSSLSYLGVENVRDNLWKFPNWSTTQTHFQQLASAGMKFDFVIPVYLPSHSVDLTEFMSTVDGFVQANPGTVKAIEGPNEVNFTPANYDGGTTYADQAALQKALYGAVRADPNLSGIPVYNLTLGSTDASLFAKLGNLSAAADYGNQHPYVPSWDTPASALSYLLSFSQIDTPGLPVVITETGYNTDPNDTYSGVNQTVQAKFTLNILLDAYKGGVAKTYLYELLDEVSDPTNGNPEYHYGLFDSEGLPKLAATAIHNLMTILVNPRSVASFTPGSLSYAVPNLPVNGNQLLLEKTTGTFDLILWAEIPIWDSSTRTEIVAPTETTTVNFGQTQQLVLIYDPLQGTSPVAVYADVRSIQVVLVDHPIIIEIPNATTPAATIGDGNGSRSGPNDPQTRKTRIRTSATQLCYSLLPS